MLDNKLLSLCTVDPSGSLCVLHTLQLPTGTLSDGQLAASWDGAHLAVLMLEVSRRRKGLSLGIVGWHDGSLLVRSTKATSYYDAMLGLARVIWATSGAATLLSYMSEDSTQLVPHRRSHGEKTTKQQLLRFG